MARTPRASVPKTSGQGVSRRAYQQGYALRNQGPKVKTEAGIEVAAAPDKASTGRQYAKAEPDSVAATPSGQDEAAALFASGAPTKSDVSLQQRPAPKLR